MKKKLMYEVPDVELIELRLENNQMQGLSGYGEDGSPNDLEESGNYGTF